jgi:hypothetical protein
MKRSANLKGVKRSKGKKAVLDLAQLIEHPRRRKELIAGNLNILGGTKSDSNYFRNAFIDILRSDSSVVLGSAGETDEVVTIDCHRVIRHPTSLHGKCGLQVTEFPLSRLDPDGSKPFDPLTEAVALPMDGKMNVQITAEEICTRVKDCNVEGHFGDKLELPEAAAAFVILKGWGELIRL